MLQVELLQMVDVEEMLLKSEKDDINYRHIPIIHIHIQKEEKTLHILCARASSTIYGEKYGASFPEHQTTVQTRQITQTSSRAHPRKRRSEDSRAGFGKRAATRHVVVVRALHLYAPRCMCIMSSLLAVSPDNFRVYDRVAAIRGSTDPGIV